MISKNTIQAFPAELTYPLAKRQLLPDLRNVFPSGFGAKEPYSFPPGTSVINPTASRAMAFPAQTGPSGGGVVDKKTGQVKDTSGGPPSGGGGGGFNLSSLLGGINIGGKGGSVGSIVIIGIFVVIVLALVMSRGKGMGKKSRHRRRKSK